MRCSTRRRACTATTGAQRQGLGRQRARSRRCDCAAWGRPCVPRGRGLQRLGSRAEGASCSAGPVTDHRRWACRPGSRPTNQRPTPPLIKPSLDHPWQRKLRRLLDFPPAAAKLNQTKPNQTKPNRTSILTEQDEERWVAVRKALAPAYGAAAIRCGAGLRGGPAAGQAGFALFAGVQPARRRACRQARPAGDDQSRCSSAANTWARFCGALLTPDCTPPLPPPLTGTTGRSS